MKQYPTLAESQLFASSQGRTGQSNEDQCRFTKSVMIYARKVLSVDPKLTNRAALCVLPRLNGRIMNDSTLPPEGQQRAIQRFVARLITHHCNLQEPKAENFIRTEKTDANRERATEQWTGSLAKMASPGHRHRY